MLPARRSPFLAQAFACWNWKCALLNATARSVVYLATMARMGPRGSLAVVVVEMAYVTLTAGIYAGMQQRALGFGSRLLGNVTVVFGIPRPGADCGLADPSRRGSARSRKGHTGGVRICGCFGLLPLARDAPGRFSHRPPGAIAAR
jgi:hypothetical protein